MIVAHHIVYSMDNRGTLWPQMFDAHSLLICVAPVPAAEVIKLVDFIDDNMMDEEDDAIGQVDGHA